MARSTYEMARSFVWRSMDRPWGRPVLSSIAAVYCSLKTRRVCRIRSDGQVWIHDFGDRSTVDTRIRQNLATPERWRKQTFNNCLFAYTPKPGDVVFDIGAGIGAETFVISELLKGQGRIYAFEAHPLTFRCLEAMVRANGFDSVILEPKAVSNGPGMLSMGTDKEAHISNSIFDGASGVEVPSVSLDSYVAMMDVEEIALLKMNIEGAEVPALQGATSTLARTRNVVVACHDFKADRLNNEAFRTKGEVQTILEEAGFKLQRRDDDERPWIRDTLYGRKA